MKKSLIVFNYIEVASLRITIAFLALIPFLPLALKNVKSKHYFPIAIAGLFGNLFPAFLFAISQSKLDSAFIGTLNATVPFFTIIFGIYFFKYKPTRYNFVGVFFGIIGMFCLSFNDLSLFLFDNIYTFLVIIATICYALSINIIKKYLYDLSASSIAALSFLFVSPFAFLILHNTIFLTKLDSIEGLYAFGYIIVLAVLGTSMAGIIFNSLLARTSSVFVSSVTYLIPVVAIIWGWYDGELITNLHILGFLIILCGVYLVNKTEAK